LQRPRNLRGLFFWQVVFSVDYSPRISLAADELTEVGNQKIQENTLARKPNYSYEKRQKELAKKKKKEEKRLRKLEKKNKRNEEGEDSALPENE